jgi:DNA repair exonuclease SbcCD ATPase subunit
MSQNITKNIIKSCFKDYHFALLSHHLEINQIDSFFSIVNDIKDSNILMFQNCLNEFGENDDVKTMLKNIKFLSENMPSHTLMFINDLSLYAQVNRIIDSIIGIINDLNKTNLDDYNEQAFLINKSMEETFKSSIPISENVTKYLLTSADKLKPRTTINYNYLSVYKIFTKESKLFEQSIDNKYIDLLEQFNRLQTQFNSFYARLEQLSAVESNYLKISEIVESYDQKLDEFQANLQKISNQQETVKRERQSFNNLADNLDVKIQLLESRNNEFRSLNLSYSLETLRYNIQNLELIDSEQARKLEEFQTTLQEQKDRIQADIDELMLKISNQQETVERERQSFNNLADNLDVKIQPLESRNNEFRSLNLSSSLETLRYNIQNLELIDYEQARKLEEFQTTLQEQKDRIQADLETFKSHLQNFETKNSKQEIKLEEIERRLNLFEQERKNSTRQLERNRKAVIFAILIGLLGVILGFIALFR